MGEVVRGEGRGDHGKSGLGKGREERVFQRPGWAYRGGGESGRLATLLTDCAKDCYDGREVGGQPEVVGEGRIMIVAD